MKPSEIGPAKKVQRVHVEEYGSAVKALSAAANGRTCGGCRHFRGDYCAMRKLDGNAIQIHTPNAVACDAWAEPGVVVKRGRGRR